MGVSQLRVVYRRPSEIRGYEKNARTHPPAQIEQLALSITEFGFTNPVLVSDDGEIIAGHGRLEAAKKLGLSEVPTIALSGLTTTQRRALVLADNRIAESSGWNKDLLSIELADLQASSFDLASIGFSDKELGEFLQPGTNGGHTDPDDHPAVEAVAVSALGDVWLLSDRHRVVCSDCRDAAAYEAVLPGGAMADVVWTDPPYNVAYGDKAEALSKCDKAHRITSRILNDDMGDAEFRAFLVCALSRVASRLRPGGAISVAHAETEGNNFRAAFSAAGFKLSACVIWRKNALVLGRADYQWMHEPILYGWKPGASHHWYGGRKETTVKEFGDGSPFVQVADDEWRLTVGDRVFVVNGAARVTEHVPSVIREDKPQRSALHPTMKPVALVERMLRNNARPGAVVLEPFGGSGTTLMAAERLGMSARVIELSPHYVDVIVRRWQEYTGLKATRLSDGMEFDHARTQADADRSQADPGQSRQAAAVA